jgi:hypothetical protein
MRDRGGGGAFPLGTRLGDRGTKKQQKKEAQETRTAFHLRR